MEKRAISTERAPKAVGPYSQAIVAGGFVFTAGQVPLDPATGKLIESPDVGDHVRRVLDTARLSCMMRLPRRPAPARPRPFGIAPGGYSRTRP